MRKIKKVKSEDEKLEPCALFSAMPPVESLKALVSHVMAERVCVNAMFAWSHPQNYVILDS